jgi:hypothetical protein
LVTATKNNNIDLQWLCPCWTFTDF